MFLKVAKGLLLAALVVFYFINVYTNRNDLYGAILFNRINFIALVGILYLAGDYVKICTTLCIITVIGGLMFHGYVYYKIYSYTREGETAGQVSTKCRGTGGSWYSKLNSDCY